MVTVLNINEPALRSSLLQMDADRRERRLTKMDCVRQSYDLIADQLMSQGVKLTDRKLRHDIPGAVLQAAVEYSWTTHPGIRHQRYRRARFEFAPPSRSSVPTSPFVEIPIAELTEQLGPFKVTPHYLESWLSILAGRIRHWQATSLNAANPAPGLSKAPASAVKPKRIPAVTDRLERIGNTKQGQPSLADSRGPRNQTADEPQDTRTSGPLKGHKRPQVVSERPLGASQINLARRAILRRYQKQHGFESMDRVATHLHVSRTALYGMVRGDTNRYSEETLQRVLARIGCSQAEWTAETQRPQGD